MKSHVTLHEGRTGGFDTQKRRRQCDHSGQDESDAVTWGTWVSQSVKCPTLAQIMISWFMSLSSVLTAQSLEPASDSVSLPLSLPLYPLRFLSLSLSKINNH